MRKQLIDMFGEDKVFKGGLRVETTINPAYQQLALDSITTNLNEEGDPSAALVSIEVETGYIRAMVGSSDYDSSKFNLAAQGRRQPGSAFKTFCLVAAIEMGMDPYNTYYESMPLTIAIAGSKEPWEVGTYGGSYYGSSTVAQATLRSDNTVYAQMAMDVGAERIVDVAHRMGITSELNADPAIALGGLKYGVSALEMASAYATLANGGVHVEPVIIRRVKDSTGAVIWEANPKKTQAISEGVAYEVTQDPAGEHRQRHRHQSRHRAAERGQDRHDHQLVRRLVLRLHPESRHRGLDGQRRRPGVDGQRARHPRDRRQPAGHDLARLHVRRRPRLSGDAVLRADHAGAVRPVLPEHLLGGPDLEQHHLDHHDHDCRPTPTCRPPTGCRPTSPRPRRPRGDSFLLWWHRAPREGSKAYRLAVLRGEPGTEH